MNDFFNPHPSTHSQTLGKDHIIIMLVSYLVVFILAFLTRYLSKKQRKNLYKIIAVVTILTDVCDWIWQTCVFGMVDFKICLPLYFCSIFSYTVVGFAFFKEGSFIQRVCKSYNCTMNLISMFLGMLFLTYFDLYPLFHFVIFKSIAFHYLMLLVPLMIFFNHEYEFSTKDFYQFTLPAFCVMVMAFIVDMTFGFDYCYFNGGLNTPPMDVIVGKFPPIIRFILIQLTFYVVTDLVIVLPFYLTQQNQRKKRQLIYKN